MILRAFKVGFITQQEKGVYYAKKTPQVKKQ